MSDIKQLLVLDDDPRFCRYIERAATKIGFNTHTVSNPANFPQELARHNPSHIIVDLSMPGMDGIQVLDYLSTAGVHAVVYVVSGVDKKLLQNTVKLGSKMGLNMGGVLSKPFEFHDLSMMLTGESPEAVGKTKGPELRTNDGPGVIVPKEDFPVALRRGEIVPFYQPIFSLRTNSIVGVEALCRWHHERLGIITPGVLMPIAQEMGLMEDLSLSLLRYSLEDLNCWDSLGVNLSLSINLAPCLLENENLPALLEKHVRQAGIECSRICLEVTEEEDYMSSIAVTNLLSRLRVKGFGLSLDDFGTGFSSLEKLHHLPFTELKIDRSFVATVLHDDNAKAIVKSALSLGADLGIPVVAEGIEGEDAPLIMDWLRSAGCALAQGYGLGKPGDFQSVLDLVEKYRIENQIF